jgi:hypothetical protein
VGGLSRSRRVVLSVVAACASGALAGLAACAPPPMAPVGSSPPRAPERIASSPEAGAAPLPPSVAGQAMDPVSDRFVSEGHGGRFEVTVWANATAREHLDGGAPPWPDGAAFAEQAVATDARGDRPAGWLIMDKAGSEWHFAAVGPGAEGATDAGIEACATCHRQADDGVFRWTSLTPTR